MSKQRDNPSAVIATVAEAIQNADYEVISEDRAAKLLGDELFVPVNRYPVLGVVAVPGECGFSARYRKRYLLER